MRKQPLFNFNFHLLQVMWYLINQRWNKKNYDKNVKQTIFKFLLIKLLIKFFESHMMILSQGSFPPVEYCPINIANRPESSLLLFSVRHWCQTAQKSQSVNVRQKLLLPTSRSMMLYGRSVPCNWSLRGIFFRGILEKLLKGCIITLKNIQLIH